MPTSSVVRYETNIEDKNLISLFVEAWYHTRKSSKVSISKSVKILWICYCIYLSTGSWVRAVDSADPKYHQFLPVRLPQC
jgi:hypothetical protein